VSWDAGLPSCAVRPGTATSDTSPPRVTTGCCSPSTLFNQCLGQVGEEQLIAAGVSA